MREERAADERARVNEADRGRGREPPAITNVEGTLRRPAEIFERNL
jgi:hypothetical protein